MSYIANACAGEQLNGPPDAVVSTISTDSRTTQPDEVFFALSGERFDGHRFLQDVVRKGARAIVVDRDKMPEESLGCIVIAVDSPRKALGRLAAKYRGDFTIPMIAVGGSNGKTTTKELIASVLRQKLNTLSSDASFNNDIGVPLTLLRLEQAHEVAVLEVGTNHPGEIAPLVKMVRPQFGVITNVGREHLEFFGDVDGVADEEGWLAELLPAEGKLFINGDNEWSERIIRRTPAKAVRIGLAEGNDWRASDVSLEKQGVRFYVEGPKPEFTGGYRINLLGRHSAVNALFAIALGAELGLNRDEIQRGLLGCIAPKMRLQLWETNGIRVLDDAYNANADSMFAALQTLQELPCKGRRVAVLGDMGELGAHSEAAHEEVGRHAAGLNADQLFAVGKMAPVMARAARAAGLNRVLEFSDVDTAAVAVKSFLKPGDLVLLKASRAARMERVAEVLRAGDPAKKI